MLGYGILLCNLSTTEFVKTVIVFLYDKRIYTTFFLEFLEYTETPIHVGRFKTYCRQYPMDRINLGFEKGPSGRSTKHLSFTYTP